MMNKNKLLIIGASGHGKVIADIALKMNQWDEIAFLDDDESKKEVMGLDIIDTLDAIPSYLDEYQVVVGIGNNKIRENIYYKLEELKVSIATLIHPQAIIGENVEIGTGTAVMAGSVINCCTVIGKGCIINTGSIIEHDNKIADFVHISPGAHLSGTVSIGERTWLGVGSNVINNINITNDCIIGAGTVVIKQINKPGTFVGNPARRV